MKNFLTKAQTTPRFIGGITAALGITLMVLGIYRGELEILFTKAINICLECIGIG